MRKDNGITVYEETDKCALDEYSEQLAKDIERKFKNEAYDDTEIKQDISNIQAEQETQNTTIESLQKENAEIKEENSRLKEDLNAFPTVNENGEYVTLDTADSRFKEFKIFGKSWQEKSSIGKNKLDITRPFLKGKVYGENGNVIENSRANTYSLKVKDGITYYIRIAQGGSFFTTWKNNEFIAYEIKAPGTLSITKNDSFDEVRYSLFTDVEGFETSYINENEKTGYEVFIPDKPSAEFLSEIRNVGDNGNLYDKDNPNVLDTPIDINGLGENVKNTYKTVWIKCKSNTTYTVSKKYDATKNRFALAYTSEKPNCSQQVEGYTSNMYASSLTIKTNSTAKYLLAYVWIAGGSVTYQEMLDSIKIEKGTQATADNGHGLGSMGIVIGNKNLLDAEKIVKDSNNERFVYFDENKNVVFTTGAVPVIVRPVKIKEKTEYTYILRCKSNTTKLNNINFIAKYTDGSQEVLSANKRTDTNEFVAKFKTNKEKTLDYVTQGYTNSASTTLIADASMILEGDYSNVNIELNNAKKQAIVFPFKKGQRLMEGDYLAEDGIHHKRKQTVLDGTENWVTLTVQKGDNTSYFYYAKTDMKKASSIICNQFINRAVWYTDVEGIQSITDNLIRLRINTSRASTVAELKALLAAQKEVGTPVLIEYELVEEEVETYTDEQKEAWKQIKNARSYEGQTNIFSTDEISPNFEVTARRNLNAILNSLQAQILAN